MAEISTRREGHRCVIEVKGELNIVEAPNLLAAMRESVGPGVQVEVNLQEATDLDLTALQIFCAGHRTAIRHSGALVLTACPAVLRERAKVAGFLRERGCAHNPNGTCIWKEQGDL